MSRGRYRYLARRCCAYDGDDAQRAELLPRVLVRLGYDVSTSPRLIARAPGDREFLPAPEILDDLQAVYQIAPEPFELFGQRASNRPGRPVVWAARIGMAGNYLFGLRPAASLTAALLMFQHHRTPQPVDLARCLAPQES